MLQRVLLVQPCCSSIITHHTMCPLCSNLSLNRFYGGLPFEWGAIGGFANLRMVDVSNNTLSGGFPDSYKQAGAFGMLNYM